MLDCYFTSYFNAWLDDHNLYSGPKKVVTGFVPQLTMDLDNVDRFFETTRTGRSSPSSGIPAAGTSRPGGTGPATRTSSVRWGCGASRPRVDAGGARPAAGRVVVVLYEDLVRDPETVMGRIAGSIGIAMSPTLLVPTFNGRPIRANSGASAEGRGVLPERAEAWRDDLDRSTTGRIDELTGDLYERAADAARTA